MNFPIRRILADIFLAGLLYADYPQIDDTGTRVRGQNHYAQIAKFATYSIPRTSQRNAKTALPFSIYCEVTQKAKQGVIASMKKPWT